jgi:hypothetical protein
MISIIFWALVVSETPRVESVHRTLEPCQKRMELYKSMGFDAVCFPTTWEHVTESTKELQALGTLLNDTTDRLSSR